MAAFFWLIIVLSFIAAFFAVFIEDLSKGLSGLPLEGRIFCGIIVAIGVIYIVVREWQDSKS